LNAANAAQIVAVVAALAAAAAYLVWLLPRLTERAALGVGAAVVVIAALVALSGHAGAAMGALAVAVAFGHLGRALARRAPSAHQVDRVAPAPTPAARDSVPATTRPAALDGPALDAPTRGAAPATLGRYRVEAMIGRGSMGAVYLGRDPQIGRQVAIKTLALTREFSGDQLVEARARFFREAETAGRLQHRDIVTIFDAGEAQDLAYIAMEFVNGHDLQMDAVPGRLLPVPQVLEITARVADALAYAHSQGVVHRDIKPANVMVDAASGLVKVMDFGVARITDANRTRTGLVLGTPSYMSPEQMAGRPVDGRSDLYSLGVMLFQLLTGTLPHAAEAMAKLMFQIANEPAPDVRSLRPELPEALANVVALALEKRPEVRYADGRQMAADLREIAAMLAATEMGEPPAPRDDFEKTETFSPAVPRHNPGP
jgi:serine/threonine-protein kinase